MPAGTLRTCRRALLALALLAAAADTQALQPAEGAGCTQLPFTQDVPEVVLDDKLRLHADQVLMEEGGLSNFSGMVTLRQGDKAFSADALDYDDASRVVTVKTESLFRNSTVIVKSQQARFDLNAQSGVFLDTEFSLPSRAARGAAEEIELQSSGQVRLKGASYTTCAPGSNAWYIEASDIHLDHEEGLGSARNTRLRFMDVPVLYLPYFQFPIDNRRRTGLLYPTMGQTSGSGLDLRWPVYLNLAPNYDATFTPRWMSQRGIQPQTDFRYLLARGEGSAHYEYLDDRKFGENRSLFRFDHQGLINRRLSVEATYAEASDGKYFEDLGSSLSSASLTHLEQTAKLTYQAPASYTLTAMVQNFQSIANTLSSTDDPYKRLPEIRFESLTPHSLFDTRAGLGADFVNFARADSVEGARLMLAPYLQYERDAGTWYVQGHAELNHTRYELTGPTGSQADQPVRTLPVIGAETGLNFERLAADGNLQTLTPRGFLLYVPYDNQDNLPLFDTGEPDFDFVQLFARNRFSGEDRLADARHVAGAATLRELDPETGHSLWSASVGQLYRFQAPRVSIPGFPPPARGATEFIGQFDYRLSDRWSTVVAGQWSPENNNFERTQFGLRYRDPDRNRQLSLSYRYRRNLLEQTDLSLLTPIWGSWKFAARARYSLRDERSRENFAGFEYGTCCWALRVSYRRFIADTTGNFDSGVYVQLQLKGLGSVGAAGSSLLPDETIDGKQNE